MSPSFNELIQQAFLRGISTRGVGRVIALVTEEAVSAQTVSRLTRVLDRQVEAFHQARLDDQWAYLILDGVWMKVRRAWGPQRVLLVAYGIRPNGQRSVGRRTGVRPGAGREPGGLGGVLAESLGAGAAGIAPAVGDYGRLRGAGGGTADRLSARPASALLGAHDAQYLRGGPAVRPRPRQARRAEDLSGPRLAEARRAFLRFKWNWDAVYPALVRRLERDLPELLNFFQFPRPLWKKLRTTNPIERCFVEVRRRTRPMVVFTNVQSVDRLIFAIFSRLNEDWQSHTLELFTQAA